MIAIVTFVLGLLKVLLPLLLVEGRDSAEESRRRPELRKRLLGRVRETGLVVVVLALVLSGCGRVVYVPWGEPVRLAETVRGVSVWSVDANGTSVLGKIDLPEGWYALPDTGEEIDK